MNQSNERKYLNKILFTYLQFLPVFLTNKGSRFFIDSSDIYEISPWFDTFSIYIFLKLDNNNINNDICVLIRLIKEYRMASLIKNQIIKKLSKCEK
jgi:hypothetical protein